MVEDGTNRTARLVQAVRQLRSDVLSSTVRPGEEDLGELFDALDAYDRSAGAEMGGPMSRPAMPTEKEILGSVEALFEPRVILVAAPATTASAPVEASSLVALDRAYVEHLERKAALFDAVEAAARDLPEGCRVLLVVEDGWAGVQLAQGDAEPVGWDEEDRTLAEQVRAAVDRALEWEHERTTAEP